MSMHPVLLILAVGGPLGAWCVALEPGVREVEVDANGQARGLQNPGPIQGTSQGPPWVEGSFSLNVSLPEQFVTSRKAGIAVANAVAAVALVPGGSVEVMMTRSNQHSLVRRMSGTGDDTGSIDVVYSIDIGMATAMSSNSASRATAATNALTHLTGSHVTSALKNNANQQLETQSVDFNVEDVTGFTGKVSDHPPYAAVTPQEGNAEQSIKFEVRGNAASQGRGALASALLLLATGLTGSCGVGA
mmetsp:Transcript_87042/g.186547  ORF Transcript_87042/g.186547 Transcript_87042/m.186547 type:complete len:246 (+) Transcript_87042:81-818(+)